MKAKFLLAASIVLAIGMTGCSNSVDDEGPAPGKTDNVLLVTLPSNAKSSRAIEGSASGEVNDLNDVTVFLMNGYLVEKAVPFEEDDVKAKYLRIEQVSSGVDRVIVVANNAGKNILDLKNMDEIKNFPFTVETQHIGSGLDNRTMMGEATVEETVDSDPNPDGHTFKKATVKLEAITARLEIGDVVPGVGVADVELVAVYVNNAFGTYPQNDLIFHKESDACWDVTVPNDPGANIGSETAIGAITLKDYTPSQYMNPAEPTLVKPEDGSQVYAFHVFPGNIPHVIMLVKLELLDDYYEKGDAGEEFKFKYGFVTFTKFNTGSGYVDALRPHNIYKMGVGKSGIKIDAKDITDKPEKGPYDLGIYVKVEPWGVQEVTPEV